MAMLKVTQDGKLWDKQLMFSLTKDHSYAFIYPILFILYMKRDLKIHVIHSRKLSPKFLFLVKFFIAYFSFPDSSS
jgi:hypothetical protein